MSVPLTVGSSVIPDWGRSNVGQSGLTPTGAGKSRGERQIGAVCVPVHPKEGLVRLGTTIEVAGEHHFGITGRSGGGVCSGLW